jgi:transposase
MTLELIREVDAERDQAANTKPRDQTCHKIANLCRIRGIGENFAAVLTREVFYRSFDNRRQIASYVGITPMPYQSTRVAMDRDRRISRAGNPRARTTMIQLAWLWLRYQPGQRAGSVVPRARRHVGRAHTADRHCGHGAQAADRALALRRDGGNR